MRFTSDNLPTRMEGGSVRQPFRFARRSRVAAFVIAAAVGFLVEFIWFRPTRLLDAFAIVVGAAEVAFMVGEAPKHRPP